MRRTMFFAGLILGLIAFGAAFAYLGGISSVSGAIVGGLLVSGGLAFTFLQTV